MANKVSFIIQLKDRFGRTSEKVQKQFAGIKSKADQAGRSIKKMTKEGGQSLENLGKKAAKTGAILTATVTTPIVLMARSMINAASDATETANKFNQVFDTVRGQANQVATSFARDFGTAGSTARKLLGDTGDLLVGFGFAGDEALQLSRKVNELAADLTSFQNVQGGVPAASSALTKALLGETESAKSLGIVIRQNTAGFRAQVEALQRSRGISVQQAKAIVILRQAQEQSRKAVGDTARTWGDYAQVVRRSQQRTLEMKESFGLLLIPVALKLTNIVIKVVDAINQMSPATKKVLLIIAGLVAVVGPLLLLLGAVAAAFAFITAPVLAVTGAIAGLVGALVLVLVRWKKIIGGLKAMWQNFVDFSKRKIGSFVDFFASLFEGRFIDAFKSAVNVAINLVNALLEPVSFISETLGLGSVKIPTIEAPSAPSRGTGGRIDGEIKVSAAAGSEVKSTQMRARGPGMRVGMNMVTENG